MPSTNEVFKRLFQWRTLLCLGISAALAPHLINWLAKKFRKVTYQDLLCEDEIDNGQSTPVRHRGSHCHFCHCIVDGDVEIPDIGVERLIKCDPLVRHGLERLQSATRMWKVSYEHFSQLNDPCLKEVEDLLKNILDNCSDISNMVGQVLSFDRELQSIVHFPALLEDDIGGRTENSSRTMSIYSGESFFSAMDSTNVLEDYNPGLEGALSPAKETFAIDLPFYNDALNLATMHAIPHRKLRIAEMNCHSKEDFLAKLHCIREASKLLFEDQETSVFLSEAMKGILVSILKRAGQETEALQTAYDKLLAYAMDSENSNYIYCELKKKGVPVVSFYDVFSDYIVLDALNEIQHPPPSLQTVFKNSILPGSTKEKVLSVVVTSALLSHRERLDSGDVFMKLFYDLLELIAPTFVWCLFGTDSTLRNIFIEFRDQLVAAHVDLFNFNIVRFADVNELAEDAAAVFKRRLENMQKILKSGNPILESQFPIMLDDLMDGNQKDLEEIRQVDAKLLSSLNFLDIETYGVDEMTRNYLNVRKRRAINRILKKKGAAEKYGKAKKGKFYNVAKYRPARTVSELWEVMSTVDQQTLVDATLKNIQIPKDLLLANGEEGVANVDKPAADNGATKMASKKKSKGSGKAKSDNKRKKKLLRKQEKTMKDTLISVQQSFRSDKTKKRKSGKTPTEEPNDSKTSEEVTYGKFHLIEGEEQDRKKRKRRKVDLLSATKMVGKDYAALLEKAKRREQKLAEEKLKNPEKAKKMEEKIHWDAAEKRALGMKIKDDPQMLQRCLKKKEKRKKRSEKKWQSRIATVERAKQQKQENRRKNIRLRIEKRKKKQMIGKRRSGK